MKKFWPFSFYFLNFAALASFIPFLVLYYQKLGFTGAQIGLLAGIPPLITLIGAPIGTHVADSTGKHKLILSISVAVAAAAVLLLPATNSFGAVFFIIVIFNIFLSPSGSLTDSATMFMLGEEKAMYGRVRMGGTIGWGVFAVIAGALVQKYGLNMSFWLFAGIFSAGLFSIQKFDFAHHEQDKTSENKDIKLLWQNRHLMFFLAISFLGGIGSFSSAIYLYPYMAGLGLTESQMGIAMMIATMTEVPIFFFGDRLVKRITPYQLFIVALVLLGIRSIAYAMISTPIWIYIVQAFGGMLFPAMWLGGVSYMDQNAPAGLKSTAQGLLGAMTYGFGAAVCGFIGGPLLESVGGGKMFMAFGVLILGGLILIEGVKWLTTSRAVSQ
jgi:PPP family 3-phenylpropionic acid transporter